MAPKAPSGAAFMMMADDAEHRLADVVDEIAHALAALAERHQREAEQDREQQHLQDVALGEGADDAVGDDVEDEIDRLLLRPLRWRIWRPRPAFALAPKPVADLAAQLPTIRPITSAKVETISK